LIDVLELSRTGGRIEGRLPIADMTRLRNELRDESGAIDYRLDARTDSDGRPAAILTLKGKLAMTCDRCGEPVEIPADRRTAFYFVRDEAELDAVPVSVEDEPEPLLGSEQFDLAALVEDEAILAVPLSPRHAECPANGVTADAAVSGGAPNPFSALHGLLRKNSR
jgi:uncharacterized protein